MNRKTKILSMLFATMLMFGISTYPQNVIHAKPKVKNNVKTVSTKVKKVLFYTVKLPKMSKMTSKKRDSSATETYYKIPISYSLQRYVHTLCLKYGIDDTVVYGIMKTESNFNPNKISPTGDYGILQINASAQRELIKKMGIGDLLNPFQNVKIGIYIIAQLYHKYGNVNETAIAYNMGMGGLQNCLSEGIYSTTYSRKVMSAISTIKTA